MLGNASRPRLADPPGGGHAVGVRPQTGVGAETLSEFFSRLRLEGYVGCSPSALRSVIHTLERLLLDTAAAWEKEGIAHGEIRPVIGAVDETFLQRMMLVFMDLATGYLLMEEVAADRSYATWFDRANARLTTFGTEVLYMGSDRAKALIKLAHTGLRCPSIPDVFHLGHDLAKSYSLAIFGRLRQAKRELEQAKQGLETLQKNIQTDSAQVAQAQAGQRPVPPRSITGRRWAVPGGSTWPSCRASCIPGGFWTRYARHRRRLRSSYEPSSRRSKRCLRPMGCRGKQTP